MASVTERTHRIAQAGAANALELRGVSRAFGALIALDGESNWLEGGLLMLVYLILAISFFEFR